jgi:Asp-tRNA(Asn)/Glu-tRNA(Gln) amidotransferase A subunit family amidase
VEARTVSDDPRRRPTRRSVLKGAGAAVCLASGTGAAADTPPATAAPSSTAPASRPSLDDLAGASRVLGHRYSEPQQRQMIGIVSGRRDRYGELRQIPVDPNVEPAVTFGLHVPDSYRSGSEAEIKLSEAPATPPSPEDLPFASVVQLSSLLRSRKMTSTELTKLYLRRLKEIGPKLNCVVNLTEDRGLREAAKADEGIAAGKFRGPLHGIPYGAKDLLAAKGTPTTWGVSPYKDRVFDYDAAVVERLERAGAVLVAKLSLGELAMGDVWFGGMTRNPWQTSEGSGGSSAGPGAAVAAGLVAFAIGSETLGSIVSPCVNCGVTGLRPTYGRLSRYGAMALCRTMDKLGPMARCVEDCAAILHAIHGPDERDATAVKVAFGWNGSVALPKLRVGIDRVAFDTLSAKRYDDVRPIYEAALEQLHVLAGAELVPVTLPATKNYSGIASMTIAAEAACNFTELLHSPAIDELVQQDEGSWPNVFRAGSMIPAADYLRAQQLRTELKRELGEAMKGVDLFVTLPFVGPQSAYTNLTGHPSLVARCGFHNDRPKMIEFIGQPFREEQLLQFGHALERAMNVRDKWPRL